VEEVENSLTRFHIPCFLTAEIGCRRLYVLEVVIPAPSALLDRPPVVQLLKKGKYLTHLKMAI
jgi:hypothetical protein